MKDIAKTIQLASQLGSIISTLNLLCFCFTGEISILWSIVPENDYSYYLLYLNIDYPYHTTLTLQSLANQDILLRLIMDSQINDQGSIDDYKRVALPAGFLEKGYSESFFANTGILLVLISGTILIFVLASLCTKWSAFLCRIPIVFKTLEATWKFIR